MSLVVSVSVESPTPRMTANLLLIDDNAVQAATRQTILRRAGYFVIAALNPRRALEQFRAGEFLDDIRLVITDHLMPGMNGAEFVRELRKTRPKLPVLAEPFAPGESASAVTPALPVSDPPRAIRETSPLGVCDVVSPLSF